MQVLSGRIILRPVDLERSLRFYGETLGLRVYREYGTGADRGVVFFIGGGYLEITGTAPSSDVDKVSLWLQVPDLQAVHADLAAKGRAAGLQRTSKFEPRSSSSRYPRTTLSAAALSPTLSKSRFRCRKRDGTEQNSRFGEVGYLARWPVGVELAEELGAALGFVGLADGLGRAAKAVERAEEAAVGLVAPADIARAPPAGLA